MIFPAFLSKAGSTYATYANRDRAFMCNTEFVHFSALFSLINGAGSKCRVVDVAVDALSSQELAVSLTASTHASVVGQAGRPAGHACTFNGTAIFALAAA